MDKFKVGDKVIYPETGNVYTIQAVYNGMYWVNQNAYIPERYINDFELEEKYRKIQQFNKEMQEIINPKNRADRRNYKPNELLTGEIYEKKQRNTSRRY